MYTEEKNEFPMKDLALKILFLVVLVALLIWLFPFGRNRNELKPLTDRIFAENINSMKDVAKTYYTNERLPKKLGDKVSMSLQEMYDKKLLIPFIDSNGKFCDTKNSYVEITRMENEFTLKTYLSCGKKADYVIEVMACNDRCKIIEEKIVDNKPNTPVRRTKSVTEYEYKRTISSPVWSAFSAWTDEFRNETNSLRRNEKTVVMGRRWISSPSYRYRHFRNEIVWDNTWSDWTTDVHVNSATKQVRTQIFQEKQWLNTFGPWTDWITILPGVVYPTYNVEHYNFDRRTITGNPTYSAWYRVSNIVTTDILPEYPNGTNASNATTRYELINYETALDCSHGWCNFVTYYEYKVERRDLIPGETIRQYRYQERHYTLRNVLKYSFRLAQHNTVYSWFNTTHVNGWIYTGVSEYNGDNGTFEYTNWLDSLPSGYTLHATKKVYSYSTATTANKDEFVWSTNSLLDGWEKTGKTKTKLVTL